MIPPDTSAQTDTVKSLAISPDSRLVVSASSTTVTVWDIESCSLLSVIDGHQAIVNSVAYRPDGQHIVTGSEDQTAVIWDITTGDRVHTLQHIDEVTIVNYSPNGHLIVTGANGGILTIWNADTGEEVDHFIFEDRIWSAEFSPDGQRILITIDSNAILMLDVATKEIIYRVSNRDSRGVTYATFHPSGQMFATTGNYYPLVVFWNAQSGEVVSKFRGGGDSLHLAYSPDGKLLSIVHIIRTINPEIQYDLYVLDTNTQEFVFRTSDYRPIGVSAFSPDNSYFVANSRDEIRVRGTTSWEVICSLS